MDGDGLLTVGQVTKRTGLSRKALRVYEQASLVMPASRSDAGYRLYDVSVLPRLDLIRRARALDVGISELGELLDIAEGRSERGPEDLATLVAQKLVQTRQRIEELQALEHQLRNVAHRLGPDATAARDDMAVRDAGSGCGSLLCTCPVQASGSKASGSRPSSGRGGDDMNPMDLEEQSTESTSASCDCGCECCAPQSDAKEDDRQEQPATAGSCSCGCGD